eukprot:4069221-Pleurochrysis_carterae.AAC.2
MSCNTTCYKRDTCNTRWHCVALFGAPAKYMANIGSKFMVADRFPTHYKIVFSSLIMHTLFREYPMRQRQKSLQGAISCYKYLPCNMLSHTTCVLVYFLPSGSAYEQALAAQCEAARPAAALRCAFPGLLAATRALSLPGTYPPHTRGSTTSTAPARSQLVSTARSTRAVPRPASRDTEQALKRQSLSQTSPGWQFGFPTPT